MKRREFIVQTAMAGIACTVIGGVMTGCKSVYQVPNKMAPFGNRIVISKTDMGTNPFVLVVNEKLQGPVYLLKKPKEDYVAVLMICTHKGCEVKPSGGYLICPCHGSEFTGEGKVLSPPADKDLFTYEVKSDDEFIYIQL